MDNSAHDESVSELITKRTAAMENADWEIVRHCDFEIARLTKDSRLFAHVFFGTPSDGARSRFLADRPSEIDLPPTYVWGSSEGVIFDLEKARTDDGRITVKAGHILHKTLTCLLRDFYRPIEMAELFSEIYPGEVFNSKSSPGRLFTTIYRVRCWLKSNCIPVEVENRGRSLMIRITGPRFGIRISKLANVRDSSRLSAAAFFGRVKGATPQNSITRDEAAKILQVSRSSALRILTNALNAGLIRREGKGRSTIYVWDENDFQG